MQSEALGMAVPRAFLSIPANSTEVLAMLGSLLLRPRELKPLAVADKLVDVLGRF